MGVGGLRPKIVIDKVAPDAIASKPRGDLGDIIMALVGTEKKVREQFDTEEEEGFSTCNGNSSGDQHSGLTPN